MKNIHVLATGKPSNLCINGKNFQNIYITNDEEIKEGDWIIHNNNIYKAIKNKGLYVLVKELNHIDIRVDLCQKIILTTDQDLIKDGVQAIDDDFLEWFFNNSNCEMVEVQKWSSLAACGYSYHIIIPQQEQNKQQSSVEWLSNQTYELFEQYSEGNFDRITLNKLVLEATKQAKAMHKEEISDAFSYFGDEYVDEKHCEQYYNDTYGND